MANYGILKIMTSLTVLAVLFGTVSFSTLTEESQQEWWKEAVIISDCGVGKGLGEVLPRLNIDVCNWCFWPLPSYFMAKDVKYVPATCYEYQEIYEDDISEFKECMAKSIYSEDIPSFEFGNNYFGDPHCPKWFDQVMQGILELIPYCDGISQDNIGVPPFVKGRGGFSEWNKSGFGEYLADGYSSAELRRMGITDIGSLDIALYILDHGYLQDQEAALNDPVFKAFVKYQYGSNLDLWEEIVTQAQEAACDLGYSIEIHGNQFGVWSHEDSNPLSVLLSQYNEVIEIEFVDYDYLPPRQHYSLVYKIGLASGEHEKPVWVRGITYDWEKNSPIFNRNFWKLIVAEGYANGGVREIEPVHFTPTGEFCLPDETIESLIVYAQWLHRCKPFLTHRSPLAKVAIIYSIPTMMWREFPTTRYRNSEQTLRLSGFARALEEAHIPYDVIIFGHPEFWNDSKVLATLSKYDVIILPGVDSLTDEQIHALKEYVAGGGRLVASGQIGVRDEDFNFRPHPTLVDVLSGKRSTYLSGTPDRDFYENVVFKGVQDRRNYLRLINAVTQGSDQPLLIKTNAPSTVTMNLYTQQNQGLCLHLLNYDYNFDTDTVMSVKNISIEIKLPEDFSMEDKRVLLLSPDFSDEIELEYSVSEGYLSFAVPELQVYDLIAIAIIDSRKRAQSCLDKARKELGGVYLYDTDISQLEDWIRQAEAAFEKRDYLDVVRLSESIFARIDLLMFTRRILFDEAHGENLTVDEARAREIRPQHPEWCLLHPYPIYPFERNLKKPLTFDELKSYDLLVIASPTQSFSRKEIEEIKTFVANGGGLVLIGNGWIHEAMNSVGRGFDVAFLYPYIGTLSPLWDVKSFNVLDITPSEITERVKEFTANVTCAIEPGEEWQVLIRTPEDTWLDQNKNGRFDPTEPPGPFAYLAVRSLGDGSVVAIADDAFFWEGGHRQRRRLGYNLIVWASASGGPYRSLIKLAEIEINRAEEEGRTEGLVQAEQKLQEAKDAYAAGTYVKARELAKEAIDLTKATTTE